MTRRLLISLLLLAGSVVSAADPAVLSTFGSRLTVIPEPDRGRIRLLPLGTFMPELEGLETTLEAAGGRLVFPPGPDSSTGWSLGRTDTTLTYGCSDPAVPVELDWTLRAPFDPSRAARGLPPAMELELAWRSRKAGIGPVRITLELTREDLPAPPEPRIDGGASLVRTLPIRTDNRVLALPVPPRALAEHVRALAEPDRREPAFPVEGTGRLALSAEAGSPWKVEGNRLVLETTRESGSARLVLACWWPHPVLRLQGRPCPLAGPARHPSIQALLRAFRRDLPALRRRDHAFRESLGPVRSESHRKLRQLALQSYFANVWVVDSGRSEPELLVWEGRPRFLDTLDVEWNNALFLGRYVPRGLASQLRRWPRHLVNGALPHDVGKGLVAEGNRYPVPMVVEERANFLLLHHLYHRWTGDPAPSSEAAELLRKTAEAILASDTDGDGLPDRGVVTTLDDAPRVIGAARNGLYLGIKAAAALQAVLELPLDLPGELRERIDHRITLADRTLRSCWDGRRLPACRGEQETGRGVLLPVSRTGVDPESPRDAAREIGCDAPSNYPAHGLLPLLLTASSVPEAWPGLLRTHLEQAARETATRFGTSHTAGTANLWLSQCIWRDLAELALGGRPDLDRRLDGYWALQQAVPRSDDGRWDLFCDSPENEYLTSYSRGACLSALAMAERRLGVDRPGKRIELAPGKAGDRVALPLLADWERGLVPHLVWDEPTRVWRAEPAGEALLVGWAIETGLTSSAPDS